MMKFNRAVYLQIQIAQMAVLENILKSYTDHTNGIVQDCSNSFANTLELLQSCTKPSISYHSNNMQYYSEVTLQVMG